MFLLSSGLSRFIRRDSFRYNLNLLFSFKRIVKTSKLERLQNPSAKCGQRQLTFWGSLLAFQLRVSSIISCVAATTRKFIYKVWTYLFGYDIFKWNRLESLVLDWKVILKEQYGKWFLIQLCSRFLTKNDWAPRNGKTMSSCF